MNIILLLSSLLILFSNNCNANEAPKLMSIISNKIINQTEGTKFRLLCSIQKGSSPLFFQWSKNDHILNSKPEVNYKIETSEELSIISIASVHRSDSGNYSCFVRNAFGTDSQSVVLNVRVAPIWVKEPKDIRVNAGDDVIVECVADGLPKPTIKWISSKGNVIENEVLNIGKFTTSTDTYECIADNGIGDSLRKVIHIYFSESPKIIPLNQPEEPYIEGSRFRSFCALKSGSRPVFFSWTKNGQQLSYFQNGITIKTDELEDNSVLSINDIKSENAGNYSCSVRNAFGSDSYAIKLEVYVPSKWINEPQNTTQRLGSNVEINCEADGSPKPKIVWRKIITNNEFEGKTLKINQIKSLDSGLYECIVYNVNNDVVLRKVISLKINVPAKFDEKYSLIQVKRGESARLKCNASGDQPLTVKWTKDNVKLDQLGGQNYEIFETTTEFGVNSELLLRTTQRTDGTVYRCDAENEHGKDEKTIKLVVVEVPGPPMNVRVKEVWSRTASVVWSPPYSGNSPISKYTVQYWRHESAPHRLHELSVSNSQTSALIKDLSPGHSYELNVVGENEVGRGIASDTITFITGEEEPTASPNDITVESRGPTTLRVTWRSPPIETWNGVIKGYYVGYRKARDPNSHPLTLKLVESKPTHSGKKAQIEVYEYFVRDLMKGTEYAIVLKAYNSAGSGPESNPMLGHTLDGDLPSAQQLSTIDSTANTISLRWYQKDIRESQSTPIMSYTIHYQKEGDPKWIEIPITTFSTPTPTSDTTAVTSYSYVLANLETGTQYKMFVTAINRYGVGDPSNIVATKTEGDRLILQSDVYNAYYDGPYYLQPSFTIPLLTAAVIIIIVLIIAFICVRKIRQSADNSGFIMDGTTLNKQFSGYTTGPRYMDFEKTGEKPLMMTEQGNCYPTPYATMPMGTNSSDSNQKPWDRPLPLPSLMKRDSHHIYDHPQ